MANKFLINFSLVCGLISAILFSMAGFDSSCKEMQENIFRIRVIANSDLAVDQELKLKIRDAVLTETNRILDGETEFDDVVCTLESSLEQINNAAENVVKASGFDYSVNTEIKDEFFETRHYDDFSLPAGYYNSLVITVGEGKGQNWWCVIYPEVCVGSCAAKLNDSVSDRSAAYAYNSEKYVIKFRTVEIFEKIKNIIK